MYSLSKLYLNKEPNSTLIVGSKSDSSSYNGPVLGSINYKEQSMRAGSEAF